MSSAQIENPFARRRVEPAQEPPELAPTSPEAPRLRAMTGHEEQALEELLSTALPNMARVSNQVLARCYVQPAADFGEALRHVHSMSVAERDAALVALRQLSLGDEVEESFACPECAVVNVAKFRLSELPIAKLRTTPRKLTLKLSGGRVVELRLPSALDQEDLFDAALSTAAERKSFVIARALLRLDDQQGPFDLAFAHSLASVDRTAIEGAIDAGLPELDLQMNADCVACGAGIDYPFEVTRFFF